MGKPSYLGDEAKGWYDEEADQIHFESAVYSEDNVIAYSDVAMKENITTISDALDLVSKMRGVYYTRKNTGKPNVGVIAQEMREVLPEVVIANKRGDLGVAYGNIIGVLIEAIKELQDEVKALKGK